MNQLVLHIRTISIFIVMSGVLILTSCADKEQEYEVELPVSAVSENVISAIKQKFPGFEITEVEIEGGPVLRYELEGKVGDKKYEIDISPDGTITEVELDEMDIPVSAVPEKVISAAKQKFPGIEITEAEIESDQFLYYEIEGKQGDQAYEIEINTDGTIIEVDQEEGKDTRKEPLQSNKDTSG